MAMSWQRSKILEAGMKLGLLNQRNVNEGTNSFSMVKYIYINVNIVL